MQDFFCGENGDDANDGRSWPTRRETITGLLRVPGFQAGDRLRVGPGTYREQVELRNGGRTKTSAGSISVTEGSKIVTGTGTNWDPAVEAGDRIIVPWLAYGLSGDGTGGTGDIGATGIFDSNGGANDAEFSANLVGFCINIDGVGSYLIAGVTDSDTITLTDINGLGFPAVGNFDFWVPSNEGSYEIESVDSDTQITLKRPWSGPDYTWSNLRYTNKPAKGYEIFRPIYLIGDETGANTDGIGGIVRITGSDNDQSVTRNYGILGESRDYWVIKGFQIDTVDIDCIRIDDGTHITIEDVRTLSPDDTDSHIMLMGHIDMCTVRRCALFGGKQAWGITLSDTGHHKQQYNIFENIYAATYKPFQVDDYSNTVIKCCISGMNCEDFLTVPAGMVAGMSVFIHDCEIHYANNDGLLANALGDIVANWNNYWDNNNDRTNVGVAGATNTTVLYIPELPMLFDGVRYPVRFYPPSEWWSPAQYTGLYPANEDIYGIARPTIKTKRSLGPYQDFHVVRDTTTVRAGWPASTEQPDAQNNMFRIAISGNPVTASAYVYLEANYAGTAPKLIVHQAGNTDVEATATGTTGVWEQLSVEYTPNPAPLEIWVELVSDNTAAAGALVGALWSEIMCLSEGG